LVRHNFNKKNSDQLLSATLLIANYTISHLYYKNLKGDRYGGENIPKVVSVARRKYV
jgi:hypothetical protein